MFNSWEGDFEIIQFVVNESVDSSKSRKEADVMLSVWHIKFLKINLCYV